MLPLVAISLTVLMTMSAFAIDLGRISLKRRDLQAVADAVALDMVRTLGGLAPSAEELDPEWAAQLARSRDANDFPVGGDRVLTPDAGCYDPTTDVFDDSDATCPVADAVRVVAGDRINFFFDGGDSTTNRRGIAQVGDSEEASFSIGSFLAAVDPASSTAFGQILNEFFPGASALSYNGLADASVTLGALAANLGFGSAEELLTGEATFREIVLATASALAADDEDQTAALAVLDGLLATTATAQADTVIELGRFFAADISGGTAPTDAEIQVARLLSTSAFLIDDEHFLTLPQTTLNIPGITQVTANLKVIEPPQIGGFTEGATASTGQFELTITPTIDFGTETFTVNLCAIPIGERNLLNSIVGGLLNLVTCLLGGTLAGVFTIDIEGSFPLSIVAAGATGTLFDIDCTAVPPAITITTDPIPASVAASGTLTISASLLGADVGDLLTATMTGSATLAGTADAETFLYPDEFNVPRPVGSDPLGLGGLLDFEAADVTLVGSISLTQLANRLITPAFDLINTLLERIDERVLGQIIDDLGLNVGGADLTALTMECGFTDPLLAG